MKIDRWIPTPPPEITMIFPQHEGWAIVAALTAYAERHQVAADRDRWLQWARDLDKELRR